MDVIQFPTGRAPRSSKSGDTEANSEFAACQCGSVWFHLGDVDLDGTPTQPAVVVDQRGRITGYTGVLRCVDCGQAKAP